MARQTNGAVDDACIPVRNLEVAVVVATAQLPRRVD
jgi:hypothetical protein